MRVRRQWLVGLCLVAACASDSDSDSADAGPETEQDASEPAGEVVCNGLDELTCGATLGCRAAQGIRFDLVAECQLGPSYAGCDGPVLRDCDAAITFAQNAAGDTWMFNDSCFPEDLTYVYLSSEIADWPTCTP